MSVSVGYYYKVNESNQRNRRRFPVLTPTLVCHRYVTLPCIFPTLSGNKNVNGSTRNYYVISVVVFLDMCVRFPFSIRETKYPSVSFRQRYLPSLSYKRDDLSLSCHSAVLYLRGTFDRQVTAIYNSIKNNKSIFLWCHYCCYTWSTMGVLAVRLSHLPSTAREYAMSGPTNLNYNHSCLFLSLSCAAYTVKSHRQLSVLQSFLAIIISDMPWFL